MDSESFEIQIEKPKTWRERFGTVWRDKFTLNAVSLPAVPKGPHESMILCSHYRRYKNVARQFLRKNKKRYFAFLGLYMSLQFIHLLGIPHAVSFGFLYTLIAFMYIWIFNELRYQMGPTAIQFGKEGLRFHWAHAGFGYSSPWIAWDLIEFVNAKEYKRFMLYGFDTCEATEFVVKRWAAPRPVRGFLAWARLYGLTRGFLLKDTIRLRIERGIIIHDNDVARMVGAVNNFLPADFVDPELNKLVIQDEDTSFTTLWLDQLDASTTGRAIEVGSAIGNNRYVVEQLLAAGGHAMTYLACDKGSAQTNNGPQEAVTGNGDATNGDATNGDATNGDATNGDATNPDAVTDNDSGSEIARTAHGSPPLGERVALKEIVLPTAGGREIYERAMKNVMREAELLRKLDHTQIVKCRDFFVEGGRAYLVLDFIEGQSLRRIVNEVGPFDERQARSLTRQMCEIMQYLHSLKPPIIHRDFTPDNLILRPDCSLVLIDFNVAEQREAFETATVVGKHAYIPPEQFRGQATTLSDLYALGCCTFWMLVGEDPEPISVSHPATSKPGTSRELDAFVAKATQMNLSDRFQSAEEMLQNPVLN
jgi:hypothetical protein